jgi:hypothetical protein
MQELLRHLRANGFKNFIVSGGGADFMGVWVERVYGIPPEQAVGSTARTTFELCIVSLERLKEATRTGATRSAAAAPARSGSPPPRPSVGPCTTGQGRRISSCRIGMESICA